MVNLMVLYPQPTDVKQFEADYEEHIKLLHQKTGIPDNEKPYTVTKFLSVPQVPAYYQMFKMPFPNLETLQSSISSAGFMEVAADANRISTGGPVTLLIGSEGE